MFICGVVLVVCVCDLFLFDVSTRITRVNVPVLFLPFFAGTRTSFTETKKQSPNTGARANNTLHK